MPTEHGSEANADRDKIRQVIQSVAEEAATLKQLKDSPETLKERFDLNDAEINALKSGKLHVRVNTMDVTFHNDMTITAAQPL